MIAPADGLVTDSTPQAEMDLIPVRMLNEFTYCPRLAYLEWAQGEFTDNLETKQGTFGHRNVDRPSSATVPAAPTATSEAAVIDGKPPEINAVMQQGPELPVLHARSLMLSSATDGLIAKLMSWNSTATLPPQSTINVVLSQIFPNGPGSQNESNCVPRV